jgi:hypothetical protein
MTRTANGLANVQNNSHPLFSPIKNQAPLSMNPPNLFTYATSELSQDAVIAWLLAWAAPDHVSTDPELHLCAVSLVSKIFILHGKNPPSQIDKIAISKQTENIDVLCEVNGTYAIIIEDKYVEAIKRRGIAADNILPIYFKTHEQSSFAKVTASGYQVLSRKDLLSHLCACKSSNAILRDFCDMLAEWESKYASYLTLPLNDWNWNSWIGFFQAFQNYLGLKTKCWDYVPNANGGFHGFWWGWHHDDGQNCGVYLQLEEEMLCFKVGDVTPDARNSARTVWHQRFVENASTHGLSVTKPSRFGSGTYMTVAVLGHDYRVSLPSGAIDLEATFVRLSSIKAFFDETVSLSVNSVSQDSDTASSP